MLDLSRLDLMGWPAYSGPVSEDLEALLLAHLGSLDAADLDVELMEATEDVEDEELFDCLSRRLLLEDDVADGFFCWGIVGIANRLDEVLLRLDGVVSLLSAVSRLSTDVECLSDSFDSDLLVMLANSCTLSW